MSRSTLSHRRFFVLAKQIGVKGSLPLAGAGQSLPAGGISLATLPSRTGRDFGGFLSLALCFECLDQGIPVGVFAG